MLKAGIFHGPQICTLINDPCFVHSMTDTEFAAWESFVLFTQNFLGNQKPENCLELVEDVLSKFKDLAVKMRIKVYYSFGHLDCFSTNFGDQSKEHGERFHQDIKVMEERYQGRWNVHMIAGYCWSLQRDCLAASHSRKSYKRKFVNID